MINIIRLAVKNENQPTAILGTNAGSGSSLIDIKGDDSFGIITVNTGDNPSGQKICDVAFNVPYGSDNLIIEIVPYNRQAKLLAVASEGEGSHGFELNCSSELNDHDVYQWTYKVIEVI